MGYAVRLIPTQHVKALTRHQKNDANDALAICETAFRPGIHFVAVKTVEQQDIKALRCARQLMVEQPTAAANQIRALAAEQGFGFPVGIHTLQQRLPDLIEDAEKPMSPVLRHLLSTLLENIHTLNEHIRSTEYEIAALCQQSNPGMVPTTQTILQLRLRQPGQYGHSRASQTYDHGRDGHDRRGYVNGYRAS